MKNSKLHWLAAGLGLAVFAGLTGAEAAEKKDKKENQEQSAQQQEKQRQDKLNRDRQQQEKQGKKENQEQSAQQQEKQRQDKLNRDRQQQEKQGQDKLVQDRNQRENRLELETKPTANGGYEKRTVSGKLREKAEKHVDGERVQTFGPTGKKQSEEMRKVDGTVHKTQYDLGGKVKGEELIHKNGSKEVTNHQVDRDGNLRAKETVNYDSRQKVVSKTVEKNVTITKNVNKTVVVNHYDRGRYGFVYRPVYIARPHVFVSWYDPYWYTPAYLPIYHPFRYAWGWESSGWYHCYHGPYWATYEVYPAPSYWVTDYLVAGYVADHYAATISAAQAHEEARLAREEAEKSRQVAQQANAQVAKDEAEIEEAKRAAAQAELRAKNAEERAAKAERQEALAGKSNPNAKPIDKETKEALRNQIEETIAEQKKLAEKSEKTGKPILPNVSNALADPKHIYPVSKTISVILKDDAPAGILSEGDLLKVEPGQESIFKDADENTGVLMRVMTSKGEENEVAAGTIIKVFVKDLQEFDSEFRAKLDEGLAAAESNKDLFKQQAVPQ